MANDPNRDLLPVREDNYKSSRVSVERIDHQILAKLPRCELEDKFLRLLDEQTHLKKLVNCQEEKIKRLGTKLLRLINEKKNGRKNSDQTKETEELHLRIIELEHENYALKDKNTVLKQQVASHSRHITVQRSPVRSAHTSPLMSIRQTGPSLHCETTYECTSKNTTTDAQLQEAERHIKKLNEEIKSLHNKIDYLQQNLERNNLDNRKTKVSENIELIRLQRSLKQQAIQIASLQAQVKNSENNQKKLKEELIRAHSENDEALHLIAVKQNEILTLGSKLEEKNLNRLEENELRQRINDLVLERDFLKERSDFLMKAISTKAQESEQIIELKKSLAEEKERRQKLEEALEATQKCLQNLKNVANEKEHRLPSAGSRVTENSSDITVMKKKMYATPSYCSEEIDDYSSRQLDSGKHDISTIEPPDEASPYCKCAKKNFLTPMFESNPESPMIEDKGEPSDHQQEGKYMAEKMKLERELQYMREMLRGQTSRCEAQQAEISRLMHELKVNDDKCNDTLQKLDLHLKIFQNLEMRTQQNESVIRKTEFVPPKVPVETETIATDSKPSEKNQIKLSSSEQSKIASIKNEVSKASNLDRNLSSKFQQIETKEVQRPERVTRTPSVEHDPGKRFVDQVFLESSDEESNNEKHFGRESFIRKLEEHEDPKSKGNKKPITDQGAHDADENSKNYKSSENRKRMFSEASHSARRPSEGSAHDSMKAKYRDSHSRSSFGPEKVKISILWLKVDKGTSLWKNDNIKLLFVDFSFLDISGEDTETPESLMKPKHPDEKCEFNFSKLILLNNAEKEMLRTTLNKPDADIVVFKVVSDSEEFDEGYDCEDVGVAAVTVRQFAENSNNGPFVVPVKNINNVKEVVGTLAVKVDIIPGLFNKEE